MLDTEHTQSGVFLDHGPFTQEKSLGLRLHQKAISARESSGSYVYSHRPGGCAHMLLLPAEQSVPPRSHSESLASQGCPSALPQPLIPESLILAKQLLHLCLLNLICHFRNCCFLQHTPEVSRLKTPLMIKSFSIVPLRDFVDMFSRPLITLETIHGHTWIVDVVTPPLLSLLFFPYKMTVP